MRTYRRVHLLWASACVAATLALAPARTRADVSLGDAGHYLHAHTVLYVNNPTGGSFVLTVHRFQWWIGGGWNEPDLRVLVENPAAAVAFDEVVRVEDDGTTVTIPAGPKGAYRVSIGNGSSLNYWYITTPLDQAVAWTGPATGNAHDSPWFTANPFVPRKWYFWVPDNTTNFTIRSQTSRGRSQREDHGLTVYSPHGQRFAVLWGQANRDEAMPEGLTAREQKARVVVEPGSDGRFWAVEVRMGDSHTYSDINIALEGVPPFLAPCPEQWFNPETGTAPSVPLYDEDEFVQSDRTKDKPRPHSSVANWTPCPSIGDPDACEIRCPARVALWNPEERELRFVVGTYLPRNMFPAREEGSSSAWKHLPEAEHAHADVLITGPAGEAVLKASAPLLHLHGGERWDRMVVPPRGVSMVNITGAEHFWMYTYPATPAVLVGLEEDGWGRFHVEAGHARNWYFFVPAGTTSFRVRASVADATDTMYMEINAPDRVMDIVYGQSGESTVAVPEGLAGKVWHVRFDIGGSTRFDSRLPRPRFPSLNITLDLQGVPPYLAPTWEQWFDPRDPTPPFGRR